MTLPAKKVKCFCNESFVLWYFFGMDFQLDSFTTIGCGIDTNLKIFYSDNLNGLSIMHQYFLQSSLSHASEGFDCVPEHASLT